MRILIIITVLVCLLKGTAFGSPDLPIIPSPQKVQKLTGNFDFNDSLILIPYREVGTFSFLRQLLEEFADLTVNDIADDRGVIELGKASDGKVQDLIRSEGLSMDSLGQEGYHLIIRPKRIFIVANTDSGLLYGVQSLKQLMRAFSGEKKLPAHQITDFPDFDFRGVMDDISRGPLSNLEFMKAQVRRLSELKINVFSFYIEHVVKTSKHFAYSPEEGITLSELQELQEYAEPYHVQLMGSFQTIGHYRNILSHPDYKHLGVSDRMLNPTDPAALRFLSEVFDELVPVFSHPIFNINGDEAYDLRRGRLRELADSIGEGKIYLDWTKSLQAKVSSLGKRVGMWGDMLLKHPEQIPMLPEETVVFTWQYDGLDDFDPWIVPFREANLDVIVCPGILNSFRLWPLWQQTHDNINEFTLQGKKHGALGVLTTVWDDGGRHFFARDWLGVAMAAEYSWKPRKGKFDEILARYARIHYPGNEHPFTALIMRLEEIAEIPRTARLDNRILKTHFFADSGIVNIDLSGYDELAKILVDANDLLVSMNHQSFELPETVDPGREMEYWEFTIDFFYQTLKLGEALIYWSAYHDQDIQNSDEQMMSQYVLVSQVEQQISIWEKLKEDFTKLWLKENRSDWMDEALVPFWRNISGLQQIRDMLINQAERTKFSRINRLQFRSSDESFFNYWLGAGPFDPSRSSFEYDFLWKNGGERLIIPAAIDYYFDQHDKQIGFKKLDSERPDRVHFSDFYESESPAVGYAYAQVRSPDGGEVAATIRCPGKFKIFLNEKLVMSKFEDGDWLQEHRIPLKLRGGLNHLILKISDNQGDWGFSFALDQPLRHRKHRYTLL